jgi:salicylate hydroxylase
LTFFPKMAPISSGLDIIILGGGIAGLTTALALTKFAPKNAIPRIQIFEIRPEPATIGGAVNLTPNALRLLDHLGAYSIIKERGYGKVIDELEVFDIYSTKLAVSSFQGPEGKGIGSPPYKALRITRGDALRSVLEVVQAQENIILTCDKKTVDIQETTDKITITFEDGGSCTGDILMGCDGIHSVTRLKHVDPTRQATYTGVCNAFGFAPIGRDNSRDDDQKSNENIPPVHFQCTGMNFAPRGMLLTSYHSPAMDSVYVGALMNVADLGSRDGWKQVGGDAEKTRAELMSRFGDATIPCVKPLIEAAQDFYMWPVFTLSKEGCWSTNRCMLLGDAAVGGPPFLLPRSEVMSTPTDAR